MKKPVLSVGIKCHNDVRIFKTLSSIDIDDVDIIVALTPNKALERRLSGLNCRIVIVPAGSQSVSAEACVTNALCNKIVITDSDTYFGPGYLNKMKELLDTYDVVRGLFVSDYSLFVPGSKVVAKYREYVHNYENPLFMPGLGINKQIRSKTGGYIFNTNLIRGSDYEFSIRVKSSDLNTFFDPSVSVYHDAENIFHDIKSAWVTGKSTYHLNSLEKTSDSRWFTFGRSVLTVLGVGRIQHYWNVSKEKGIDAAIYYHLWATVFLTGYNLLKLKRKCFDRKT